MYTDNYVGIKNFQKNQKVNDNIKKGIARSMSELPEDILKAFESL